MATLLRAIALLALLRLAPSAKLGAGGGLSGVVTYSRVHCNSGAGRLQEVSAEYALDRAGDGAAQQGQRAAPLEESATDADARNTFAKLVRYGKPCGPVKPQQIVSANNFVPKLHTLFAVPAFEQAYKYHYSLEADALMRGVTAARSDVRFQNFIKKWSQGIPVKVAIVGGSVSQGGGASIMSKTGFGAVFTTWLQTAIPGAKVKVANVAIPGTRSSFMMLCMDSYVDRDVDLLVVDYCVNDGYHSNASAKMQPLFSSYEALLRKALDLPKQPAVIGVQVFRWGFVPGPSLYTPNAWLNTIEDDYNRLLRYYNMPSVSIRNAIYHLFRSGTQGYRPKDFLADKTLHPNDAGHKFIADLLVYLVQETMRYMVGVKQDFKLLAPVPPVPAPVVPGNSYTRTLYCVKPGALSKHLVVKRNWTFSHDKNLWGVHKFGFITKLPDAVLQLRIPTTCAAGPGACKPPRVVLYVGHLKSYVHMGTARLSCGGGCKCTPRTVDAHHASRVSQTYLAKIDIDVVSAQQCLLQVTTLRATTSGEHKFKITTLIVVDDAAYHPQDDSLGL